jgi:hypothetical protein
MDPDPYQNVTDPQSCIQNILVGGSLLTTKSYIKSYLSVCSSLGKSRGMMGCFLSLLSEPGGRPRAEVVVGVDRVEVVASLAGEGSDSFGGEEEELPPPFSPPCTTQRTM